MEFIYFSAIRHDQNANVEFICLSLATISAFESDEGYMKFYVHMKASRVKPSIWNSLYPPNVYNLTITTITAHKRSYYGGILHFLAFVAESRLTQAHNFRAIDVKNEPCELNETTNLILFLLHSTPDMSIPFYCKSSSTPSGFFTVCAKNMHLLVERAAPSLNFFTHKKNS